MADGFDGFDDRYNLERYDSIASAQAEPPKLKSWLDAHPDAKMSDRNLYIVQEWDKLPPKSNRVRFNAKLYTRVFEKNDGADIDYLKKPAKVKVFHPKQSLWNPFTWPMTVHIQGVVGPSSSSNFKTGTAVGDLVDTLKVSKRLSRKIDKRWHDKNGYVSLSIEAKEIPLLAYVLMRHPSDDWNLAVRFLYISTLSALLVTLYSEAYDWPSHFRHMWDWIDGWIRLRA